MSRMDIKDVCDADYAERVRHYLEQIMPDGVPPTMTVEFARDARRTATEEMVNEIHCMLLHLTKDARE